jgi:hypothetical protein
MHDVSIERIQAPNAARTGQTKAVKMLVRSGHQAESVTVDLFKSSPGFEQFVGSVTHAVPSRGGQGTTFDSSYAFTAEDAAIGKVTFRAAARIDGARDALPGDNQAIAPPTEVRA